MSQGANVIHQQIREALETYIKTQYFEKTPLLLSAIQKQLNQEGVLYQRPYIESSPSYKSIPDGIQKSCLPEWMKRFFKCLAAEKLGVYTSPFVHQIQALEQAQMGRELFVSTGTGSGKTECFIWPLLAKLATEAREEPDSWKKRSVRAIIMYPMNALVSDQVSRLRKILGDPKGKFERIFQDTCGQKSRRPQFGMYTGRTPYPGEKSDLKQDRQLAKTFSRFVRPEQELELGFFHELQREGKIPAKENMDRFIKNLYEGQHVSACEDAELITRFEMQKVTPDILITNYSMLEYMLFRPREKKIWENTSTWLHASTEHKLLFVIDEAHMYRGSAGGEVAFLLRRLFHKLQIEREQVQFILTTASMPNQIDEDREKVMAFARALTASKKNQAFCYLIGEKEEIGNRQKYDIAIEKICSCNIEALQSDKNSQLNELKAFWKEIEGSPEEIQDLDDMREWMYSYLTLYRPFNELIQQCRGTAVSLRELAERIFPSFAESQIEKAIKAVENLLIIAPLARSKQGAVLFPARMHMLFRGLSGVFACTNPECPHSHSDNKLTLGEIFLSDGPMVCPHCGSMVYELYNDRRCGALFFKGYILHDNAKKKFLWRYPGQIVDHRVKEIHLFIPPKDFDERQLSRQTQYPIRPCYLDVKSGFIDLKDDSLEGESGIRKLYYCEYTEKGRPQMLTFSICPHCWHQLSQSQLTSFSTRGNISFFNLIKAQFEVQPAIQEKAYDKNKYPNEGRKVLVFSDSRQRAARLARDMSNASGMEAVRQLFILSLVQMQKAEQETGRTFSLNDVYNFFCRIVDEKQVPILDSQDREKFLEDCRRIKRRDERSNKKREYRQVCSTEKAPDKIQEYLLRLYCAGYNTLFDSAISWLEPTDDALEETLDYLGDRGLEVSGKDFIEFFNAWILYVFDSATALGDRVSDNIRLAVRKSYKAYGLDTNWNFSTIIRRVMGWKKTSVEADIWRDAMEEVFLRSGETSNKKYVSFTEVKPCFDLEHIWYKCERCSEMTPFLLKQRCPRCGNEKIHALSAEEMDALAFWRLPIKKALDGETIRVIDTEEHTAQLSYKDQRDSLWSTTEQYEFRFQDLVQEGELPVDILSCTTTMEVGIDIGSLVAVGLRNIPPMRENYQQRAGRAGRRGASLSTIVTFCEDGPHDTLYFHDPVPMLRGEPRSPWIDVESEKLLQRHLSMVVLQEFLGSRGFSLDTFSAAQFVDEYLPEFICYIKAYKGFDKILIPDNICWNIQQFKKKLIQNLEAIKEKRELHPELFHVEGEFGSQEKSVLDAVYEEGIVPTFSFPKNVVSTYIADENGKMRYQVSRGLDMAIGEYAPGKSIVVDKKTYQIGGLYYPGSEWRNKKLYAPARAFMEDPNYLKVILSCPSCNWFGLYSESVKKCPFCGNSHLESTRKMLRPWGFAPKSGKPILEVQLEEEYTTVQPPLYSTLPEADEMKTIPGFKNVRVASRSNQRIIMINSGIANQGFMVCPDCGAAMPGNENDVLNKVERPYRSKYIHGHCSHKNAQNVNLGYDFITDMLVLEFSLGMQEVSVEREDQWLVRAAQSLVEALRLAASKLLDIEFTELVTGFRLRRNEKGNFVDIFLYDNLSSGAGYAVGVFAVLEDLLDNVEQMLTSCDCKDACYKCLKHYRNQNIHGLLDRHAALQLLYWGRKGEKASPLTLDEQWNLLKPMLRIFEESGCLLKRDGETIWITKLGRTKKLIVYPAMWAMTEEKEVILIKDIHLKYSRPYALRKIMDKV